LINKYGIDIDLSLNSGQYFLWEKKKKSWYGIYGETILKITEKENERIYEFDSFPEYNNWQKKYFQAR